MDQKPLIKAIKILGQVKDPQSVEILLKTIEHEDLKIKYTSIEALGKIGDIRAIESLSYFLTSNLHYQIKRYSADALGLIHHERAFNELIKGLIDPDYVVINQVKSALENIAHLGNVEILTKNLTDSDQNIRLISEKALEIILNKDST